MQTGSTELEAVARQNGSMNFQVTAVMSSSIRGGCEVAEMSHIAVRAKRKLPSGRRVQRGRSPLWWGFGGTPQPFRSASHQGSGRMSASGDGRTAVRPYESGIRPRDSYFHMSGSLCGHNGAHYERSRGLS